MNQLMKFAQEAITNNPEYKSRINELFQLCLDEIDEGGSEEHEIQLCYSSIYELIEKHS
jgi:hypothetical protein